MIKWSGLPSDTTGNRLFAVCQSTRQTAYMHTAKALPCAAHGKEHTAFRRRQRRPLPCALYRAHGKAFAVCRSWPTAKKKRPAEKVTWRQSLPCALPTWHTANYFWKNKKNPSWPTAAAPPAGAGARTLAASPPAQPPLRRPVPDLRAAIGSAPAVPLPPSDALLPPGPRLVRRRQLRARRTAWFPSDALPPPCSPAPDRCAATAAPTAAAQTLACTQSPAPRPTRHRAPAGVLLPLRSPAARSAPAAQLGPWPLARTRESEGERRWEKNERDEAGNFI